MILTQLAGALASCLDDSYCQEACADVASQLFPHGLSLRLTLVLGSELLASVDNFLRAGPLSVALHPVAASASGAAAVQRRPVFISREALKPTQHVHDLHAHEQAVLSVPVLAAGQASGNTSGSSSSPGQAGSSAGGGRVLGALSLGLAQREGISAQQIKQLLLLSSALGPVLEGAAEELVQQLRAMLYYQPEQHEFPCYGSDSEGGPSSDTEDEHEAALLEADQEQQQQQAALRQRRKQQWAAGACRDGRPEGPDDPGSSAAAPLRVPSHVAGAGPGHQHRHARSNGRLRPILESEDEPWPDSPAPRATRKAGRAGSGLGLAKQEAPACGVNTPVHLSPWSLLFKDAAQEQRFRRWSAQGAWPTDLTAFALMVAAHLLLSLVQPHSRLAHLPPIWLLCCVPLVPLLLLLCWRQRYLRLREVLLVSLNAYLCLWQAWVQQQQQQQQQGSTSGTAVYGPPRLHLHGLIWLLMPLASLTMRFAVHVPVHMVCACVSVCCAASSCLPMTPGKLMALLAVGVLPLAGLYQLERRARHSFAQQDAFMKQAIMA